MKECKKCKEVKPLEDFYKDSRNVSTGRTSYCKECAKKVSKQWYATSDKYKDIIRTSGLKHRFGITSDDYWKMSESQDHLCYICKTKGNSKFLHVDHDHKTNEIRGLLCKNCNHGLGNFKDNIQLLKNAIEYLRDYETV